MNKTQEALKLALEALTHLQPTALTSFYTIGNRDKAITAIREALAEQPATPFGIGGGLVAIKTLLSRDPCAHAKVAIEMIDAMLAEQPAQQESEAVRAAWMAGYTEGEREAIEKEQQPAQQQEPVFWRRPCSNGMYEGPIHNAQIERVRKEYGAWHPLYTSPPAQRQEPVAWVETREDGGIYWGVETDNVISDDPSWLERPMPVYTSPPASKPLSREVIERDFYGRVDFVRQVEAAHGIKEQQ